MKLKAKAAYTWEDIARIAKIDNRQTAYDRWQRGNVNAAKFFADVFGVEAKDLIKW
jgi:hypothetical protein